MIKNVRRDRIATYIAVVISLALVGGCGNREDDEVNMRSFCTDIGSGDVAWHDLPNGTFWMFVAPSEEGYVRYGFMFFSDSAHIQDYLHDLSNCTGMHPVDGEKNTWHAVDNENGKNRVLGLYQVIMPAIGDFDLKEEIFDEPQDELKLALESGNWPDRNLRLDLVQLEVRDNYSLRFAGKPSDENAEIAPLYRDSRIVAFFGGGGRSLRLRTIAPRAHIRLGDFLYQPDMFYTTKTRDSYWSSSIGPMIIAESQASLPMPTTMYPESTGNGPDILVPHSEYDVFRLVYMFNPATSSTIYDSEFIYTRNGSTIFRAKRFLEATSGD